MATGLPKVQRVQMELHEHVRHDGETKCSEVVKVMTTKHGFVPVKGACSKFDPKVHDETDIVFAKKNHYSASWVS